MSGTRILVAGATGVFGSRLAAGIVNTTDFDVILAGRTESSLRALAATFGKRASALVLDVQSVTPETLAAAGAFAIADAAGPFQGSAPHLARAAVAAGIHYIDLADARDFVASFPALNEAARSRGVTLLTGASTTPALTNAALDHITQGWRQIDTIEIAVSPGNRAPRGLSVVRAILSYSGNPVRVWINGGWQTHPGWGLTVRRALPGLGRRFLSLAETPDLDVVASRFAVKTAIFRAGLELPVLHLGLLAASLPVRARLLPSLAPFAPLLRRLANLFLRSGSDRGGMLVEAAGTDAAGNAVRAQWSLVAEAGDGPVIPTLPALAAIRALAAGKLTERGAFVCAGILPLAAIEAEFRSYRIAARQSTQPAPQALYQQALGARFSSLPPPVQRLHLPGAMLEARGMARVEGASSALARLIASIMRLPRAAPEIPVSVTMTVARGRETWRRDFGGRGFASVLSLARRRGQVTERFGPLQFDMALQTGPEGITGMPITAWRLGPIPLPLALAPAAEASETVDAAGRFTFDVAMRLPFGLGRVVRYQGWLVAAGG
jgi:hypothetical protein